MIEPAHRFVEAWATSAAMNGRILHGCDDAGGVGRSFRPAHIVRR
jgi:hypothetical protein